MQDQTIQALKEGKWEKAAELLGEELKKEPEDTGTIAYNLCVALLKLNKYQEAEQICQQYIVFMNNLPISDIEEIKKEIKHMKPKQPRKPKEKDDSKTVSVDGAIKTLGWFKSDTKFSDVIGLHKVKAELNEKVIGCMTNPNLYKKYGASLASGILLYGPPGVGKTLLGKATAGEANGKMVIARIPEILSRYQGDSEKNLHTLFEGARENQPALIFMDELDAIAMKRADISEVSSMGSTAKSIINTLLTEMDGINKDNIGISIIGASNRPWDIDVAFRRSGRFNKAIYVPPPNLKERIQLFDFYLKRIPYKEKINYLKLGLLTFGFTPADIAAIGESVAAAKASGIQYGGKKETKISNREIIRAILKLGRPTLYEWYSDSGIELGKLPAESAKQYQDLQKDILFWKKGAKARNIAYKILGSLIPTK